MRKKSGKFLYIPIVATFTILFVMFAVWISAMKGIPASSIAVNEGDSYEGSSDSGFEFVETEGKNGIKYYVIRPNTTQSTIQEFPTVGTTVQSSSSKSTGTTGSSTKGNTVSRPTTAASQRSFVSQGDSTTAVSTSPSDVPSASAWDSSASRRV